MLLIAFLFSITDALHISNTLNDKVPVWVLYNYEEGHKKSLMELNLKTLHLHATSDRFAVHLINDTNLNFFISDMPEEYERLPDNGARSDLVRAGLLAHHGGVYMDADVLFSQALSRFTDKLADNHFVAYTSPGQNCVRDFSSNIIAARAGNRLSTEWWKNVKDLLKQTCAFDAVDDLKNGVCCKTPMGVERRCHIPWGGLGELTAHPIFQRLVADEIEPFKMFCFKEDEDAGFAPDSTGKLLWRPLVQSQQDCTENSEVERRLPSGQIAKFTTVRLSGSLPSDGETQVCPCWQPAGKEKDLQCADGRHVTDFFSRLAFHQFSMIVGFVTDDASMQDIIDGPWVASKLYRDALGM